MKRELDYLGPLNLSKVLYKDSFWPPSGLKNRTPKTVPKIFEDYFCHSSALSIAMYTNFKLYVHFFGRDFKHPLACRSFFCSIQEVSI